MTKESRMTKSEGMQQSGALTCSRHLKAIETLHATTIRAFELRAFFRHSDFVIRHFHSATLQAHSPINRQSVLCSHLPAGSWKGFSDRARSVPGGGKQS